MGAGEKPSEQPQSNLVGMPPELLSELIQTLKSRRESEHDNPIMERMLLALEAQAAASKRLGDEFARTVRRSNATHPNMSVFTFDKRCKWCRDGEPHPVLDKNGVVVPGVVGPLAHPKPKLKFETYVCGGKQFEDSLTPLELDLFNQFESSRTARGGTWSAVIKRDGTTAKLFINFPSRTLDELQDLPRTLPEVLNELLFGEEAVDAHDMIGEMLAMKKRIKELEAAATASAAKEPVGAGARR